MEIGSYSTLFSVVAFVLGAAIGSFLNVGIYRLPRDLSVNKPRRSFCPVCHAPIAWQHNLPLLSWLMLRGRCAKCGAKIAFRYFGVELLTALLFLAVWRFFPWQIAVAYWVFVSILIVATFVDLEHFIIPDQVTIGGTIVGIIASFAVPELMRSTVATSTVWHGGLCGLAVFSGAATARAKASCGRSIDRKRAPSGQSSRTNRGRNLGGRPNARPRTSRPHGWRRP